MGCFLASRVIDQAISVNSEKAPLTTTCRGWHINVQRSTSGTLYSRRDMHGIRSWSIIINGSSGTRNMVVSIPDWSRRLLSEGIFGPFRLWFNPVHMDPSPTGVSALAFCVAEIGSSMFLTSWLATRAVGRFLSQGAPYVVLHSFLYFVDSLPRQIHQPLPWRH